MFESVPLTEADLDHLLSAARELRQLGIESKLEDGESGTVRAFATNREALAILDRNGFTVERFEKVLGSVGFALAALEAREKGGDGQAKQEQALEKMKGQLSPEQYAALSQQMQGASAMMQKIQDQPQQNLDLVAAHKDEIKAAFSSR
jgi:hypothetical protein